MQRIGFIGLGVMGYPMAGHLARAGHRVTVYNRTAAKAQAWSTEFGGRHAPTPREAASGARIVCGDTKVVPKGAADKIFINTSGVGTFPLPEQSRGISVRNLKAGDAILVSRDIGSHGACILMARDALQLGSDLKSDCTTLWPQVEALLQAGITPHALRDATRGGVNAVAHEFAVASGCGIELHEAKLPVNDTVRGVCELLGLDALNFANEGKLVIAVAREEAENVLTHLRSHALGCEAAIIGEVVARPGVRSVGLYGVKRTLDLPHAEPLPRIC